VCRQNSYRAFSLYEVQLYGKQLLATVAFLHNMQLIHTDLKLENILLANSDWEYHRSRKHGRSRVVKRKEVVVIDLGSATYENEHHASVVSTRHYRAPEVVLGTLFHDAEHAHEHTIYLPYRQILLLQSSHAAHVFSSCLDLTCSPSCTRTRRIGMVISMRHLERWMHSSRASHRGGNIPNAREPGTSCHDGSHSRQNPMLDGSLGIVRRPFHLVLLFLLKT
jgi:serine/threonine protein kinase